MTCVTAACDDCGVDYEQDDHIIHFTDQADAEHSLAETGWRIRTAGLLTCPRCAAQQDCATYGHHWHPWRRCLCDGRIDGHIADPLGACTAVYRWCDRCIASDRTPAAEPVWLALPSDWAVQVDGAFRHNDIWTDVLTDRLLPLITDWVRHDHAPGAVQLPTDWPIQISTAYHHGDDEGCAAMGHVLDRIEAWRDRITPEQACARFQAAEAARFLPRGGGLDG